MNKLESILFISSVSLLLITGCAQQQQRAKTIDQICVQQVDKSQAMQTAENVLAKMHFAIDKADAEQGIIITRPLSAAQFFEFWRKDNIGSTNALQANLHSIRRIVKLNIARQENQMCISCNINVQRFYLPERQIVSSSEAYRTFTKSKGSIQRLKLYSEQRKAARWVDLGNDPQLETEILKRLEKQISQLKEKAL